jgi:hypothetical protein
MKCCICSLDGVIDYEHILSGDKDLWEVSIFKTILRNRHLDTVLLGIIFNQLGYRFDRADGYICGACRVRINNVITKFYQPIKQLINKEFTR